MHNDLEQKLTSSALMTVESVSNVCRMEASLLRSIKPSKTMQWSPEAGVYNITDFPKLRNQINSGNISSDG